VWPWKAYFFLATEMGPEHTASLSLVRRDVLSLIKELYVLFSHKNISWGNLVSVLMDSGNVMRATKVDMKKPFERQNMSLLTYSLMAVPPQLSWGPSGQSWKSHLKCTSVPSFFQMKQKGAPKRYFSFVRNTKYNSCILVSYAVWWCKFREKNNTCLNV
jgi:hypothetical protein